jgi:FkbH-like protein
MCLAQAGYFESIGLSDEDRQRTAQYQANLARAAAATGETDMDAYLKSLDMVLHWSPIDAIGASRVVQLVNKTNQFNLTTRRTTDAAIDAVMADPAALTLQLRLVDRFGNNGLIAVVIGRCEGRVVEITDWLMSCRVLQRGVEAATFNLVVAQARRLGARRLCGTFRPTAKNAMVADHYSRLGFMPAGTDQAGGTLWTLDLDAAVPLPVALRYDPPLPHLAELEAAL